MEHRTSISKMLLALVFAAVLVCPLAGSGRTEEFSKHPCEPPSNFAELESHCGLRGDHDKEGLSLLQVGAKRLQKAAAAKSAADVSNVAMAKETNVADRQGQGRLEALLARARMRSSATFSIVVVAVVGHPHIDVIVVAVIVCSIVVALTFLALAHQPGHGGRDSLGFEDILRATQSGPYGRQGGPGSAYYPAADSYEVPDYAPYSAGFDDGRPSCRDSFTQAPVTAPATYAQAPVYQTVAQPQVTYAAAPRTYAAAPQLVQTVAAPVTYAAAPTYQTVAAPTMMAPSYVSQSVMQPATGSYYH